MKYIFKVSVGFNQNAYKLPTLKREKKYPNAEILSIWFNLAILYFFPCGLI